MDSLAHRERGESTRSFPDDLHEKAEPTGVRLPGTDGIGSAKQQPLAGCAQHRELTGPEGGGKMRGFEKKEVSIRGEDSPLDQNGPLVPLHSGGSIARTCGWSVS
jgi:hypothetical protein